MDNSTPPKLTIDTNVINTKQKLEAMNTIEKWASEGKVVIQGSFRLKMETSKHPPATKKANDIPNISEPAIIGRSFFDNCYITADNFFPDFPTIASILFNTTDSTTLDENKGNDVMHLLSHIHGGGDIFITNNTKDFMNSGRREALLKLKVIVMTPEELVSEFQQKYGWS